MWQYDVPLSTYVTTARAFPCFSSYGWLHDNGVVMPTGSVGQGFEKGTPQAGSSVPHKVGEIWRLRLEPSEGLLLLVWSYAGCYQTPVGAVHIGIPSLGPGRSSFTFMAWPISATETHADSDKETGLEVKVTCKKSTWDLPRPFCVPHCLPPHSLPSSSLVSCVTMPTAQSS